MSNFDKSFINVIIDQIKIRLNRNLSIEEMEAFNVKPSGIAYEMMMDFISDERKPKDEIENYIASVVEEINKANNN